MSASTPIGILAEIRKNYLDLMATSIQVNKLSNMSTRSSSYIIREKNGYFEAISRQGNVIYGGAGGNGDVSGTDFSAVLKAAAENGLGGKIHLTSGVFPFNGVQIANTATVKDSTQQWLEIEGEGMGNTILQGNVASAGASSSDGAFTEKAWIMLDSFDGNGIRFYLHDFQIDGQHDSQTHLVQGVISRYGRDSMMQRLFIRRCSTAGIQIVGPNLAYRAQTIKDCMIFDINDYNHPASPTAYGIHLSNGVADVWVEDNYIGWMGCSMDDNDNAGTTGAPTTWHGIGIMMSDSCEALRNTIWAVDTGFKTYWDAKDMNIQQNFVDFSATAGIFLDHCSMTTVLDNRIRIPYGYGVYLTNSTKNMINNNKFLLRTGYDTISMIVESGTSDYNTIMLNHMVTDGAITWSGVPIYIVGSHSVAFANFGWKIEGSTLSPTFGIDSVAVVTVTIPHGLDITPSATNCSLTIIQDTNVDDYTIGYIRIVSIDSTNVYCKVSVTQASGTAGATAKLSLIMVNPYVGIKFY